MTNSLKTWWQGLKYWQKGGIILSSIDLIIIIIGKFTNIDPFSYFYLSLPLFPLNFPNTPFLEGTEPFLTPTT